MRSKQSLIKIFGISFFLLTSSIGLNARQIDGKTEMESPKVRVLESKIGMSTGANESLASLYNEAVEWLKTPYRRGGMSKRGMDCSGLVSTIYKNVFGIKLHRSSRDISKADVQNLSKDELMPGDLVFFATSRRAKGVNHVGVYLGNNHFVHASVSKGVIVSSLNESYYKRTWVKGGRPKTETEEFQNLFADHQHINIDKLVVEPFLIEDVKSTRDVKDIRSVVQKLNAL